MYLRKLIPYMLLVFPTVLINSCSSEKFQLQFVSSTLLTDFPSASAIEYNDGRLYIFGDDASTLLIVDTSFKKLDSIRYLPDTAYRISKETKTDIESAAILESKMGEKQLVAMSSFSGPMRRSVFIFPVSGNHPAVQLHPVKFFQDLRGIEELNIEGFAIARDQFILANRANTTHKTNQLIITENFLDETKIMPSYKIKDLVLDLPSVAGISGLFYLEEKDILFFTASEEDTPSAMKDGTINDSYLGWIRNFSGTSSDTILRPDTLIKLASIDPIFIKQKIESVCVSQVVNDHITLYLAADNDNGQSRLFKMRLKL